MYSLGTHYNLQQQPTTLFCQDQQEIYKNLYDTQQQHSSKSYQLWFLLVSINRIICSTRNSDHATPIVSRSQTTFSFYIVKGI